MSIKFYLRTIVTIACMCLLEIVEKAFFIFIFMNANANLTNLFFGRGDRYGEIGPEQCRGYGREVQA